MKGLILTSTIKKENGNVRDVRDLDRLVMILLIITVRLSGKEGTLV